MEPSTNNDNKVLLDPYIENLRIQQEEIQRQEQERQRQRREQERQRRLINQGNQLLFRPINENENVNEEARRTPVDYLLDYDRNTPNSRNSRNSPNNP